MPDRVVSAFSHPDAVASYAERTGQMVPGLHGLHRMVGVLIGERARKDARVLVLGAGGGLELKALADMHPGWRFEGIDPSPGMLKLAQETLGPRAPRVKLYEGTIDIAPSGPFDAAVCLLTLHFLQKAERQRTVDEIYRRLKPGAPFVTAHHSFQTIRSEGDRLLRLNTAFAVASGVPAAQAENILGLKDHLPILSPGQDEEILRKSGFSDIELFYAAFTFKGWVAYRPPDT